MYGISDKFIDKINSNTTTSRVSGTITTSTGTVVPFSSDDISQGSFTISAKCVSSDDFDLGSVYAQELSFTLKSTADRYTFYDAVVTATYSLLVDEDVWEDVPLGVFNIIEAKRVSTNLSIKAIDNMVLLDDESKLTFTDVDGTPYQMLSLISTLCGVGVEQTENEIKQLPNGESLVGFDAGDAIKPRTPRDILSYVATATGTFATMSRSGKIKLSKYASAPVVAMNKNKASGTSISDYIVNYQKVKAKSGDITVYAETGESGQEYVMREAPFFENLGEDKTRVFARNILDEISLLSFTPCEVSYSSGNPALDLGDMIEVDGVGIDAGRKVQMLIMSSTWTHKAKHQLKCYGMNPRLSKLVKKEDAQLSEMSSKVSESELVYNNYTNLSEFNMKEGDSPVDIIKITYLAKRDSSGEFKAMINVESFAAEPVAIPIVEQAQRTTFDMVKNASGEWEKVEKTETVDVVTGYSINESKSTLKFFYRIDDAELTTVYPEDVVSGGKHMIWLYLPLELIPGGTVHKIDVFMHITGEPVRIEKLGINAVLVGQGMASMQFVWDGTLSFEEEFQALEVNAIKIKMANIVDTASVVTEPKRETVLSEQISPLTISTHALSVAGLVDSIAMSHSVLSDTIDVGGDVDYSVKYISTENNMFELQKKYEFISLEQPIDSGLMCTISIDTEQFDRVDGIEVIAE